MKLYRILFVLFFNISLIASTLSFTPKELKYIKKHPVVYASNNFSHAPFDYMVGNKSMGYSIELLQILAKKIGIEIQFVKGYRWHEYLKKLKNNQIDLLHTATKIPSREKFAAFSQPYFQIKPYFFTLEGSPKIKSLKSLEGKTIAVRKGWAYEKIFRKQYPKINLYLAQSENEMFEAVKQKKACAFVYAYHAMQFHLALHDISGIEANNEVKNLAQSEASYLYFLAHKKSQPLITILNKALDALSITQKQYLESKWLASSGIRSIDNFLTQKEHEWIEKNPTIKLAYVSYWDKKESFHKRTERKYINLLSKYSNINIQLIPFDSWREAYKEASKGKSIDGILSLSKSKDSKEKFNFLPPYYYSPLYLLAHSKNDQIRSLENLKNSTIYIKNKPLINEFIEELEYNIKTIPLRREEEIFQKLMDPNSKIKAALEYDTNSKLLEKNNIKIVKKIYNKYGDVHIGISKHKKEIYSILKKAHNSIPKDELARVQNISLYNTGYSTVTLTEKEKEYLNHQDEIVMCVAPSWMPFSDLEKDFKPSGMASDFIHILSTSLNHQFSIFNAKEWMDVVKKMKNKECDIMTLVKSTKSRKKYLSFTKPLVSAPYVVASHMQEKVFIDDFEQIRGKTFAVVKSSAVFEDITHVYPDINLVLVKDTKEGLEKVHNKKVYGFIDTSTSMAYELDKLNYLDIKIVHKLPIGYELSFGVNKDKQILFDIVSKVMNNISQEELSRIYQKWITVRQEKIVDYSLIWKIVIGAGVIFLLFFFRHREMAKSNRLLKKAQEEIESKNQELQKLATTDSLTNLYNRAKIDALICAELDRYERYAAIFSLCVVDVDYFKKINDTYGHQIGDMVLQEIARLMEKYTRQIDFVGRWGGEEFIILCPQTDKQGALQVSETLKEKIALHSFTHIKHVTVSIGVSTFGENDTKEKLIQRADEALYMAKNSGRNRVVYQK